MTSHSKIDANGVLQLPPEILARMGLATGGEVVVEETAQGIIIRPLIDVLREVQEFSQTLLAGKDRPTVDSFIAERRREAARE